VTKKPVGLKDFKIEMVPIGDLIAYVNNPKAHPEIQVVAVPLNWGNPWIINQIRKNP
jgi:hypothetical protein